MNSFRCKLLVLFLLVVFPIFALGNPLDTVRDRLCVRGRMEAEGFFYNSEFSHPLKPGYTLPGVLVAPTVHLTPNKWAEFIGGYRCVVMAGRKRPFVHHPVLSLRMCLRPDLMVRLGTLPDMREHGLPAWVYVGQWAWLHPTETGAQIKYMRGLFRAETWIDWSNFIWFREQDNERFLYGFHVQYGGSRKASVHLEGLHLGLFALASHVGGQIDDSPTPVQTSVNLGLHMHYTSRSIGRMQLRIKTGSYFAFSNDGREASPLSSPHGWAMRPYVSIVVPRASMRFGYFVSQRYTSLRGEELFSSYSEWSEGRFMEQRHIATGQLRYRYLLGRATEFVGVGEAFYDMGLSRFDWAFSLQIRMRLEYLFV